VEVYERVGVGGGVVKETLVLGVSPQYRMIRNLLLIDGRFFDEIDDSADIKCAVVTDLFARERFGNANAAIGQSIEIIGVPFYIIGVFRESVNDFGQSEIAGQTILVPYSTAHFFTGTEDVKQLYFSMRDMDEVSDAAKEIVRIVESRHRIGSIYKAQTLKGVVNMAADIADALTAVLVLVAAVTLAVGGVGIMNIMLANVNSRIREIGIRKAVGATSHDIMLQFLAEAVMISMTGGIIGTLAGLAVPLSARFLTDYNIPISAWSVVIALTAATLVGVICGTAPAGRAAKLDPVEALKSE
jgi:putative ABC transport system permease protein